MQRGGAQVTETEVVVHMAPATDQEPAPLRELRISFHGGEDAVFVIVVDAGVLGRCQYVARAFRPGVRRAANAAGIHEAVAHIQAYLGGAQVE